VYVHKASLWYLQRKLEFDKGIGMASSSDVDISEIELETSASGSAYDTIQYNR